MKSIYKFLCGSVLVLAGAAVPAEAYLFDAFNGGNGTVPSGAQGWGVSAGVYSTNAALVQVGPGSLFVPTLHSVSNGLSTTQAKIWTDFYTIPRPFLSDSATAPALDPTATAQFFVNSNGMWTTISGKDGGGYLTNTWTTVLGGGGGVYPTVNVFNVFYRVSVLHDYTASPKTWALFVNDKPLATNLLFMTDVTSHEWAQIQNLGGDATNVCWLDEFSITNRVPVLMTNNVPGTDIPEAVAYAHFGALTDPRPTNQTTGAYNDTGIQLQFGRTVADGRQYVLLGSAQSDLSGLSSNTVTDDSGLFQLDNALATRTRYFYRIATLSADGQMVITNSEVYAGYKQTRQQGRSYITGVPVTAVGADASLAGPLGQQLAKGLAQNDVLTVYVGGVANVYTRNAGLSWTRVSGALPSALTLTPGLGLLIQAKGVAASSNTILVGLQQTNSTDVVLAPNSWNIVAWPYDNEGVFAGGGGALSGTPVSDTTAAGYANGDYAWIQQAGTLNPVQARYINGSWRQYFNTANGVVIDTLTLQPGDGIMYHSAAGSTAHWTPTRTP